MHSKNHPIPFITCSKHRVQGNKNIDGGMIII